MKKYKVKINCPGFKKDDIIEQFSINKTSVRAEFGLLVEPGDYPEIFEEVKEPLFVTEDGVPAYKDSYITAINLKKLELEPSYNLSDDDVDLDYLLKQVKSGKDFKYFSTKEAAEKYIELNKLRFSLNNFYDASNKCFQDNYVNNIGESMIDFDSFKRYLGI